MQKLFFQKGISLALYSFLTFIFFVLFDFELLAYITFFVTVFILFSYRKLELPLQKEASDELLAPVSGKVFSIKPSDDPSFAYEVIIESGIFDNATLIVPTDVTLQECKLVHGTRLEVSSSLFQKLNENLCIIFEKEDIKIKIEHFAKRSLFGMECFISSKQDQLKAGEIYGYGFNCRTVVFIPNGMELQIKLDQKLQAGQHTLGYFSKKS